MYIYIYCVYMYFVFYIICSAYIYIYYVNIHTVYIYIYIYYAYIYIYTYVIYICIIYIIYTWAGLYLIRAWHGDIPGRAHQFLSTCETSRTALLGSPPKIFVKRMVSSRLFLKPIYVVYFTKYNSVDMVRYSCILHWVHSIKLRLVTVTLW